jgi:hypothetical protein
MVLVNANGKVGQMGAVADFIEVEPRYERAVEACLGDLLQHILVERLEHVSAGLKLIRQEDAGRCGFVVGSPDGGRSAFERRHGLELPVDVLIRRVQRRQRWCAQPSARLRPGMLSSCREGGGPFPNAIQAVMGGA